MRFRVFGTIFSKYIKYRCIFQLKGKFSTDSRSWSVLFFGTDEFSVETLKKLHRVKPQLVNTLEIVISKTKDKRINAVHKYALDHELPLYNWPVDVPKGKYDVGVVASFGHLIPEKIISSFPWGMINVHASLLPRWRGAAPIVHAVLNGDSVTGITIMKIEPKHFDVGNIIMQESYGIPEDITTKKLTKHLASFGADLLIKCLENLPENLQKSISQSSLSLSVTKAPKITSKMAEVDWNQHSLQIYRQYRALTGYFDLETCFNNRQVKLSKMLCPTFIQSLRIEELFKNCNNNQTVSVGSIYVHRKRRILCVRCQDQWVGFERISVKGYKLMNVLEFYNGFLTKMPCTDWIFNNKIGIDNSKCETKKIL